MQSLASGNIRISKEDVVKPKTDTKDLSYMIKRGKITRYPWHKMEVGCYFFVKYAKAKGLVKDVTRYTNKSFSVTKLDNGMAKVLCVKNVTFDQCNTIKDIMTYLEERHGCLAYKRLNKDIHDALCRMAEITKERE